MLQDASLKEIQKQFDEKNSILSIYGAEVASYAFYKDIFGDLDLVVPMVVIDEDEDKKYIRSQTLSDCIVYGEHRNDVLLGGCTYFHNWISKDTAKDIYTLIIDMDNVYSGVLLDALQRDWKTANGEFLPMPTYIVNSGTGLHLYFVFDEPIPHYHSLSEDFDMLYRTLAEQQTTRRVFLKKQVQWFGQDFRIAGGLNKYNWKNSIFRVGEKWDIDKLADSVGLKDIHFLRYGEGRVFQKEIKPQKKGTIQKGQGWHSNKAFYDYAVANCREKTKEGNRYLSMCALVVIAWKCNVERDILERDLLNLLPVYNKDAHRKVKEKEVYSALKMYNERAMLTPRARLELWQGWDYTPIKRNGRSQDLHLRLARASKQILKEAGEMRPEGRPKGSSRSFKMIFDLLKEAPELRKCDIIRKTGLSKPTVYKYYDKAKDAIKNE